MVRYSRRFLDLYLYGNFHIAFCAVALTLTTARLFALNIRLDLIAFIFFGTLFGYNLHRLPGIFDMDVLWFSTRKNRWIFRHRQLLTALSVAAGFAFAWTLFRLHLRSQLAALIPGLLSFAYAFPVVRVRRRWIQLRQIPGIKIFVIAGTWACCCALLPYAGAHRAGAPWLTAADILWVVTCGMLVFSLAIPFDIRDLRQDPGGLKTLPGILGVQNSIRLSIGALAVSATLAWTLYFLKVGTVAQVAAYSGWCAIASLFIYRSTPERPEYYFSLLIDGLLILLWAMVFIAQAL